MPAPTKWVLRVFDPKKMKKVSVGVIDNGVLVCYPKPALRVPPAMALQADALELIKDNGVKRIVFHDKDSGERFGTSVALFDEKGMRFDRGHGPQVALLKTYFDNAKTTTLDAS